MSVNMIIHYSAIFVSESAQCIPAVNFSRVYASPKKSPELLDGDLNHWAIL